MKRILLIILLTSLDVFALSSAPVNTPNGLAIDSLITNSKLAFSTKDKIVANHIASLYDMSLLDFLNKSKIALTKKEIKKNALFQAYLPWIINLEKLALVKNTDGIVKLCQNEIFKNKLEIISLQKNLERICANGFIEKSMKALSEKSFFKKSNLFFLKNYTSLIYYRVSNKRLINFLDKTSFNKKIHAETSKVFIDFFMSKNKVPSAQVLSKLEFTPLFNEYIQRRGLSDASSKQVFYEELDHYADDILSLADKEVSETLISKKINEISNFFNLSRDKLPLKKSFDKIHVLGKSLSRRKYYTSARMLYRQILSSKKKNQYEEAAYDIIWTYLSQKNSKDALKFVKSERLLENFDSITDPRLMFWTAHTLEVTDKKESQKLHSTLIGKYPLSYYAILSTRLLKEAGSKLPTLYEIIPENTLAQSEIDKEVWDLEAKRSLKRLRIWSQLNLNRFQEIEKSLLLNKDDSAGMQTLIAKVFRKERDYLASFRVIYKGIYSQKLSLTKDILEILYPKPFWTSVVNNKQNIDPFLAISLIRQESGFNPEARSRVGATGLMQLMPNTARMFVRKVTVKGLEDPFLNIKIGTQYFSKLLKRYDASVVHSLAAYNAGESRVDRWQSEYFNGDTILHNIEEIPFLETRKYVKLIFRNVFFYKFLEEPTKVAGPENLNLLFAEYLGYKD